MKAKHLVLLALVSALVLAFTACSKDTPPEKGSLLMVCPGPVYDSTGGK